MILECGLTFLSASNSFPTREGTSVCGRRHPSSLENSYAIIHHDESVYWPQIFVCLRTSEFNSG